MTPGRRAIGVTAVLVGAVLGVSPRPAAEPPSRCPMIGATFANGPIRLTMALLPRGSDGSAVVTLWRLTALDPHRLYPL